MLMRHLNSNFANTLPPGVTLDDKDAKSLLTGTETQGFLTLTAAKDAAPCDKQQCVVLGSRRPQLRHEVDLRQPARHDQRRQARVKPPRRFRGRDNVLTWASAALSLATAIRTHSSIG